MKPILENGVTLSRLVSTREDGTTHTEYLAENEAGEKYSLYGPLYELVKQADGWHAFRLEGVPRKTMRRAVRKLVRLRILRTSRFVWDSWLIHRFILLPIGKDIGRARGFFARWNRLLPRLALLGTVLAALLGLWIWHRGFAGDLNIPVLVGLLLLSVLLHETGHLAASVAYGCETREMGILLAGILPMGAYVLSSDEGTEGRQRAQLYLAGPESNGVMAGIYMLLALWIPGMDLTLFTAAVMAAAQGLLNCIPAQGLDGHGALSAALGVESLHDIAKDTVFCAKARRRLLRNGPSGRSCFCLLTGVLLCDGLMLGLIGLDIVELGALVLMAIFS